MDVSGLDDFYVDIDGDIKTTSDRRNATFLNGSDKLGSEYFMAADIQEIQTRLKGFNPDFEVDGNVMKQYSIKRDADGNEVAMKIYSDHDEDVSGVSIILIGYEIFKDGTFLTDYYFIGEPENVKGFINEALNDRCSVRDFPTHSVILHSMKYDMAQSLVDFKTYYVREGNEYYFSREMIPHFKAGMRF